MVLKLDWYNSKMYGPLLYQIKSEFHVNKCKMDDK